VAPSQSTRIERFLDVLRCPDSGGALRFENGALVGATGRRYRLSAGGIPMFAERPETEAARVQHKSIKAPRDRDERRDEDAGGDYPALRRGAHLKGRNQHCRLLLR
jgi:hypothetical protein